MGEQELRDAMARESKDALLRKWGGHGNHERECNADAIARPIADRLAGWFRALPVEERAELCGLTLAPRCWYYPEAAHAYTTAGDEPLHEHDRPLWVESPPEDAP